MTRPIPPRPRPVPDRARDNLLNAVATCLRVVAFVAFAASIPALAALWSWGFGR